MQVMKKIAMSLLVIGILAIAGSAQASQPMLKNTRAANVIIKTSSSSFTAKADENNTTSPFQNETIFRHKHKHHKHHKKHPVK